MNFELKRYLRDYVKRVMQDFPNMVLPGDYKVRPEDLGKRLLLTDDTEWDIVLSVRAFKVAPEPQVPGNT